MEGARCPRRPLAAAGLHKLVAHLLRRSRSQCPWGCRQAGGSQTAVLSTLASMLRASGGPVQHCGRPANWWAATPCSNADRPLSWLTQSVAC